MPGSVSNPSLGLSRKLEERTSRTPLRSAPLLQTPRVNVLRTPSHRESTPAA